MIQQVPRARFAVIPVVYAIGFTALHALTHEERCQACWSARRGRGLTSDEQNSEAYRPFRQAEMIDTVSFGDGSVSTVKPRGSRPRTRARVAGEWRTRGCSS